MGQGDCYPHFRPQSRPYTTPDAWCHYRLPLPNPYFIRPISIARLSRYLDPPPRVMIPTEGDVRREGGEVESPKNQKNLFCSIRGSETRDDYSVTMLKVAIQGAHLRTLHGIQSCPCNNNCHLPKRGVVRRWIPQGPLSVPYPLLASNPGRPRLGR